jgi:hypothetical protein
MNQKSTEILLINSAANSNLAASSYACYNERFAPLGLFCLSYLSPDKIRVLDIQNTFPDREILEDIVSKKTSAIILRVLPNQSSEEILCQLKAVKSWFPQIRLGFAGKNYETALTVCDFIIYGTGKQTILNILNGIIPSGIIEETESPAALPIPENILPQRWSYSAQPEKTIANQTLEIFRPWLGLDEFSQSIAFEPDFDWLYKLLKWLKISGFNEFHLRPGCFKPEHIHKLRSIFLSLDCNFAISFNEFASKMLAENCTGESLKQVWLYEPSFASATDAIESFDSILSTGCLPCLAINHNFVNFSEVKSLLAKSQRLSIIDIECWKLAQLKKVFYNYWSFNGRFFKRLFMVRSLQELISFMKTAVLTLDILLTSNRKGK